MTDADKQKMEAIRQRLAGKTTTLVTISTEEMNWQSGWENLASFILTTYGLPKDYFDGYVKEDASPNPPPVVD